MERYFPEQWCSFFRGAIARHGTAASSAGRRVGSSRGNPSPYCPLVMPSPGPHHCRSSYSGSISASGGGGGGCGGCSGEEAASVGNRPPVLVSPPTFTPTEPPQSNNRRLAYAMPGYRPLSDVLSDTTAPLQLPPDPAPMPGPMPGPIPGPFSAGEMYDPPSSFMAEAPARPCISPTRSRMDKGGDPDADTPRSWYRAVGRNGRDSVCI